ncbi:MAG: hypothetical protein VX152_12100, partial [Pseudomonadota bacterium]|nr:hypothetical protein [Pseudomonadota bacterium]
LEVPEPTRHFASASDAVSHLLVLDRGRAGPLPSAEEVRLLAAQNSTLQTFGRDGHGRSVMAPKNAAVLTDADKGGGGGGGGGAWAGSRPVELTEALKEHLSPAERERAEKWLGKQGSGESADDFGLKADALLRSARVFRWRVSWIGDVGANAGMTPPGATGWQAAVYAKASLKGRLLHADVDTRQSGFADKTAYPGG